MSMRVFLNAPLARELVYLWTECKNGERAKDGGQSVMEMLK